jgi:hypothetical protein
MAGILDAGGGEGLDKPGLHVNVDMNDEHRVRG